MLEFMNHVGHQLRSAGSAITVLQAVAGLLFFGLVLYILMASGLAPWWVALGLAVAGLLVLRYVYLLIKTRRS